MSIMMLSDSMERTVSSDSDLVARVLSGRPEAFAEIVARYQSLLCSLAYSATGDLSRSEDMAQDAFLTAWKQLATLREPARLRSWLCQIARNLIYDEIRRAGREPSHAAVELDELQAAPAHGPLPSEHAITKEEEAILWRSIEKIPTVYREPLVLFYREHQSVESVAAALDISEDAVKQRLSRGRRLLQEQVVSFIEGALERTSPTTAFTAAVVASLPVFAVSADAATVSAATAKSAASAKAAAATGILSSIAGIFLILFGNYAAYRLGIEGATGDEHKRCVRRFYLLLGASVVSFAVVLNLCLWLAPEIRRIGNGFLLTALILGNAGAFLASITALTVWYCRVIRAFRAAAKCQRVTNDSRAEYSSRLRFFGLPLVHVCRGGTAKGWFAIGDSAIGGIFAYGGFAVAPVSVGGCACGLMAWGGSAFGLLSFGGLALGGWAFGGLAIGWQAMGACALGFDSAVGAAGLAFHYALGLVAQAAEANSQLAQARSQESSFFTLGMTLGRYAAWLNLLWVLPLVYWWRKSASGRRSRQGQSLALFSLSILLATSQSKSAHAQTNSSGVGGSSLPARFDDVVRDDFFAGFGGDQAAFARAMKTCEEALAKNPKYAQAIVWHGAGVFFLSGRAFRSNDFATGMELWKRGLEEMQRAVTLEPTNVSVLIPRGASLIPASRYIPEPNLARQLLETGVSDYERVLQLQQPYFSKLSVHARGELLFGLAEAWFRLDDEPKSRSYLQRIAKECDGTPYGRRAKEWLEVHDSETLKTNFHSMTCMGCHVR